MSGLIDAAHVIPVKEGGSNHPGNGLPLCPTHHRAFDAGLFWIDPETLDVSTAAGMTPEALRIATASIDWMPATPNPEALRWRADQSANP